MNVTPSSARRGYALSLKNHNLVWFISRIDLKFIYIFTWSMWESLYKKVVYKYISTWVHRLDCLDFWLILKIDFSFSKILKILVKKNINCYNVEFNEIVKIQLRKCLFSFSLNFYCFLLRKGIKFLLVILYRKSTEVGKTSFRYLE